MIIGDRVRERLAALGMSQGELARRVGVSQPTINNLIRRSKKGSAHLHKVARELGTTSEYLAGEVDDPSPRALPPEPAAPAAIQHVTMSVALPSQPALTRMYDAMLGILDALPDNPDRGERARLLAQWLPIGLSNLRDLLPDPGPVVPAEQRRELDKALSTAGRGSRA